MTTAIRLLASSTLLSAMASAGAMECQRYGAIYKTGENITFSSKKESRPAKISGTVYDSSGKQIAEIECQGSTWNWTPPGSGYYEIEFLKTLSDGRTEKSLDSYKIKDKEFKRGRHSVAIVPTPLSMARRSPVFGFSDQLEDTRLYPLADLLGFSFSRIHAIGWGCQFSNVAEALEPERGKYNWSKLDKHIELLKQHNFTIIGNLLYTPRWASPHPDKTKVNICVPEFSAYAPVKNEYISDFIRELCSRYGRDIKIWEPWNEPNLPGQSCFWNDTPENFINMFIGMSKAFRKYQPDCELWIGGLGPRPSYLKFYEITQKHQLHLHYDKLALHGKLTEAREFRQIDQKLNIPSKPWVNSESHDILYNQSPELPGEQQIALELVKHTLLKIKHNAGMIALFSLLNLAEMESLPTYFELGHFTHSAGLLRRRPRVEPRLAAVVYAVMTHALSPNPRVKGEYKLDNGKVHAVAIDNGLYQSILFWNTMSAPVPIPALLRESSLRDWEGRSIENTPGTRLEPGILHYASCTEALLEKFPKTEAVLVNSNDETPAGSHPPVSALINPADTKNMIRRNWSYVSADNTTESKDFKAAFRLEPSETGLGLRVLVNDSIHIPAPAGDREPWNYDSLQFSFDTGGRGLDKDIIEFVVADSGKTTIFHKNLVPDFEGDLPANWTMRQQQLLHGAARVSHPKSGQTLYEVEIPWSELYPLNFSADQALRFSVLVNNNDGKGRAGWTEWGSGIGKEKSARNFGALYFSSSPDLFAANDLKWIPWKARDADAEITLSGDSAEIRIGKDGCSSNEAVQLLRGIQLKSNSAYLLVFNANCSTEALFKVSYMLGKSPWRSFATMDCRTKSGANTRHLRFKTGKLPENVPLELHFLMGMLPQNSRTVISNIRLYELGH